VATKTYVHDGREVVLTGRKAQRKTRSGKTSEVVEVKPADPETGSFKAWVKMSELYEINSDGE